jgi:Bax protein
MSRLSFTLLSLLSLLITNDTRALELPEIRIISSVAEMITLYQQAGYWGEIEPDKTLEVPPMLVVATVKQWRQEAAAMTVQDKKELFYRALLPLVLYSNAAIAEERKRLLSIVQTESGQVNPDPDVSAWFLELGIRYRVIKTAGRERPVLPEDENLTALFNELLLRVDIIPASLALGQGAYESGYGTSRFALEGNSFFGQWTYGGKGMSPAKKRANKGNYGVAAYEWPLESVRSYMMNLNTHRAYTDLRVKRAELREQGKAVSGEVLAQTLLSYSERGLEYVNSLTGMMRFNQLHVADDAQLSQEPLLLIVHAKDEQDAVSLASEISGLRANDELKGLIVDMGIEF